MANDVFAAVRRRNVSPKSSTLHVQTRDIDCSELALAPEDGEFVMASGARPGAKHVFSAAAAGDIDATDAEGSSMRMVWGSARRSDRAVTGGKRTTVFMHGPGIDLDVKCYIADAGAALATAFPVGTLLTVGCLTDAEQGEQGISGLMPGVAGDVAQSRFLLRAMAEGAAGWAVGFIREAASGVAGNDSAIKIHLYGTPRYHGSSD